MHEATTLREMAERESRPIPEATVARLPVYLRSLAELADERTATISSERLAEMAGVNAAKVRKDLSYLGSYGTRGVGYDVEYLLFQMSRELGLTHDWPVVMVGIGNLGRALANYRGFTERGYPIAALVDTDPDKVGTIVHGMTIRHIDELPVIATETDLAIGEIATPAEVAQEVADKFKASQPVIMNLQGVDKELSRRLIDFASGLCYGIGGQMERVAGQVYLMTPSNVEISAEDRRRLEERGYDA